MHWLLLTLDLIGTFVFALSGAAAGVDRQLDLFGVLVLAYAAATTGGIIRDVLIGSIPPAAISDWRYLAASTAAGAATFFFGRLIERVRQSVMLYDAIGLSAFAVAGATKALAFGLDPVMAAVMGMVTGIGGGFARDLILSDIPIVLRADLYAVAALAGAAVAVGGETAGLPPTISAPIGAMLCFTLRWMAMKRGWRLPIARR